MDVALTLLAVVGFAAAVARVAGSALALARAATEAYYAKETAGARARRGDLTGMAEAEERARAAKRGRRRRIAALAGWTAAVALPAATPWPRPLYAAYAVVWVVVRGLETRTGR
ncbi:MAG: hypothetical protein ACODAE_03800 [Gemmatimonadota bacterium]